MLDSGGAESKRFAIHSQLNDKLAPPEAIRDNHPKTLLTIDSDPPFNYNGIRQISVIDFLLDRAPWFSRQL